MMPAPDLVQFLHLLATTLWIGGMVYTSAVLVPALSALEPPQRGLVMAAVAKRFTIVAWSSVLLLLITGLLKTPGEMMFDTSTDYGLVLTIKHVLFLVMILIGLIITFAVAPKLRSLAPKPGEPPSTDLGRAQKRLELLSGTNLVLGILVLLLISMI